MIHSPNNPGQGRGIRPILLALLPLLLLLPSGITANTDLKIHIRRSAVPVEGTLDANGEKNVKAEKTIEYDILLSLGKDYFLYTEAGLIHIFDFKKKRILTLAPEQKIYQDDSLHYFVDFRISEFNNRIQIGKVLQSTNVKDNPMLPVLTENSFSIIRKKEESIIEKSQQEGWTHYASEGLSLLSAGPGEQKFAPEELAMFLKFFRYYFGGHPQILEELQSRSPFPGSLRYYQYEIPHRTFELSIRSMERSDPAPYSLEGYAPGLIKKDPDSFDRLLLQIRTSGELPLKQKVDEIDAEARSLCEKEELFECTLAYLEVFLMTGRPLPENWKAKIKKINADPQIQSFFVSLEPKSEEEAKKAIAQLKELESHTSRRVHLLKIFEANVLSSLGQYEEALALIREALQTNPLITGAYKDAGELYQKSYHMLEAWACFDAGRNIAPDHPLILQVENYKRWLEANLPGYY